MRSRLPDACPRRGRRGGTACAAPRRTPRDRSTASIGPRTRRRSSMCSEPLSGPDLEHAPAAPDLQPVEERDAPSDPTGAPDAAAAPLRAGSRRGGIDTHGIAYGSCAHATGLATNRLPSASCDRITKPQDTKSQELLRKSSAPSCLRVASCSQSLMRSSARTPDRIDVSQIVTLSAAAEAKQPHHQQLPATCRSGKRRTRWNRYIDDGQPSSRIMTMTNSTA